MARMKLTVSPPERQDLPTALRRDAPTRREQPHFVEERQAVVITGLRIPFLHLVWHLIKFALALIPAGLVLGGVVWAGYRLFVLLQPYVAKVTFSDLFPFV